MQQKGDVRCGLRAETVPEHKFLVSEATVEGNVFQVVPIRNLSAARKNLSILRTNCACVNARLSGSDIEPNGVELLTVGISPTTQEGVRQAQVEISCDGADAGVFTIKVPFVFVSDVSLYPSSLQLRPISGDAETQTIKVTARRRMSQSGNPVLISRTDTVKWVGVRIVNEQPVISRDGEFEILEWTVELKQIACVESGEEPFGRIQFSVEGIGNASLPCWGDFRRGVVASPVAIRLPNLVVNQTVTRRLVLRASDSQVFSVVKVLSDNPDIVISQSTTGRRNVHIFEVAITPSNEGQVLHSIQFKTDHPKSETITTTVKMTVLSRGELKESRIWE